MKTKLMLFALASGLGTLTGIAQEVLPFAPTPSASTPGLSMLDSTYKKRVEPIQQTATAVFQAEGYRASRGASDTLIFEREGTQANNLAQNGIVATQQGAQTVIRFRTDIIDLGGGSFRLQGQAFMVRNAGDSFFEDEHRLANFRSGPYQKLLDEVAKRLQ